MYCITFKVPISVILHELSYTLHNLLLKAFRHRISIWIFFQYFIVVSTLIGKIMLFWSLGWQNNSIPPGCWFIIHVLGSVRNWCSDQTGWRHWSLLKLILLTTFENCVGHVFINFSINKDMAATSNFNYREWWSASECYKNSSVKPYFQLSVNEVKVSSDAQELSSGCYVCL